MTPRPGIYSFTGPYKFLSNFYIEPDGTHVEGEYQRAKCAEAQDRKRFEPNTHTTPFHSPAFCKGLGKKVLIRADWEEVKVDIMLFYVTKKFKDHYETLGRQLKYGTRGLYLEERNTWGDTFWGTMNGKGQNVLGEILMIVREEL